MFALAIVFTNVTVVDVRTGALRSHATVTIQGDRIAAIGTERPLNEEAFDARGAFLIPGLWDMHAHTARKEFLALYIANGVTGVRDMGGDLDELEGWRQGIAGGALTGPRLVFSGPIVDGPHAIIPGSRVVESASEAREAVRSLTADGADFVKVYNYLSPEAFFTIAEETKRRHVRFAGHVPIAVRLEEASAAGQASVEHLLGLLYACSRNGDTFRRAAEQDIAAAGFVQPVLWSHLFAPRVDVLGAYDPAKAARLFRVLKKNGTWIVPTLVVLQSMTYPERASRTDPRLDYLPSFIKEDWLRSLDSTPDRVSNWARRKEIFPKELFLVRELNRAGVGILAGTDSPNAFVYPGSSLHEELSLLVEAGLSPLAALQSATLRPAQFLGLEKELGTVEVGKTADLVLLGSNPLDDIRSTKEILAVVKSGRIWKRDKLDALLKEE